MAKSRQWKSLYPFLNRVFVCVKPTDRHASPVVGGQPACECQMCRVWQNMWQRSEAAGLALPLVQSYGEATVTNAENVDMLDLTLLKYASI